MIDLINKTDITSHSSTSAKDALGRCRAGLSWSDRVQGRCFLAICFCIFKSTPKTASRFFKGLLFEKLLIKPARIDRA